MTNFDHVVLIVICNKSIGIFTTAIRREKSVSATAASP